MNKSFLYRTLHRIPCDVFEKCSAIIFFILIFWPALYSALYYNHYDYWIPLFSIAYWDTGALALILVLVYIAKNVITNPGWLKNTFHSHLWAWLGLLLLLWITLCSLLAKDWSVALNGSDNRCEGLLMYCFYGAFTGCAILIKSDRLRKLLICWFSISSLAVCACMLQQYVASGSSLYAIGLAGPFLHFNHCGYYLAMASIASALSMHILKKKPLKLLFLIIYCTDLTFLIINDTFGGYLAVFTGCIAIMIMFGKKAFSPLVLFILVTIIVCTVFSDTPVGRSLNASITSFESDQVKLITGSKDVNSAGTGRIYLWKKGLSYISKSPILGFGPEGLAPLYAADGMVQNRPANEFLYYAGCFGIPGLILYLAIIFSLAIHQWKRKKTCPSAVLAAACLVITYLCSSCFGNSVYYTTPYFFMFLGLCSGSSITAQSQ